MRGVSAFESTGARAVGSPLGWWRGRWFLVAAGLLLLAVPRGMGRSSASAVLEEPTPRGAAAVAAEAPAPAFWIYRVARDGSVRLAKDTIGADDELAFAYSNTPAGGSC